MFYDLRAEARVRQIETEQYIAEAQYRREVHEQRRQEREAARAREPVPAPVPQRGWAW